MVIDVLRVGSETTLMKVNTNGHVVHWQPDTGTQKDIWDVKQLARFEQRTGAKVKLQETSIPLYPYGSKQSLTVRGKFSAELVVGDKMIQTSVYVTEEPSRFPLISEDSAIALGLVKYNREYMVNSVCQETSPMTPESVAKEFPEVFSGNIGKSSVAQVEIMVDLTVHPVVQKSRNIPINIVDKAVDKVYALVEEDIVERFPENEPRTWVSPPVIAAKPNGDIRFCVDMRLANKAILRPFTQIPTLDDVRAKFVGARKFSKLDLKEAYHQFELTTESRNITTFYGPDGLYRFKRLNYGTKSAQDILQIQMQKLLAGIPHQINLADDTLIGGTQKEQVSETGTGGAL